MQRIVVARARTPRDAAVQHCLDYLDSEHGRSSEAVPYVAYAPIDLDGQVRIVVDIPPEVYELVRLVVHLARCLYA